MATFYGSRLECARMRRGLSRAAMMRETGIDRRLLSEYEADRRTPPPEHVEVIARATGFLPEFFYLGEMPYLDPNGVSFRIHVGACR